MYEIDIEQKIKSITGNDRVKLSTPPENFSGDLSTNAAMVAGMDPKKIAEKLEEFPGIKETKIAGPGFVNITLTLECLKDELKEILSDPKGYGKVKNDEKILIEMVSSNPTGPLHIGHGRGAALGDALGRILERLGYKVYREYYVNNTGRQMELLGESVLNTIRGKEVPEDGYQGDYIKEVAGQLENCTDVRECAVKAAGIILKKHMNILEDFRVSYDNISYEKDLVNDGSVKSVIQNLEEKNVVYKKEEALWFNTTKFGDDRDRVLKKKDGKYTYFATDCAYHKNKADRVQNLINVWGADHHGYVDRLKAFWQVSGLDKEHNIDILLYQLVNLKRGGEKVSMSTRAGEFVTLKEVIEEVGVDAARFFLLMRSYDSPLEFDLQLAKEESKKNPVYYIQYSHTRICSIFRKAGIDIEEVDSSKVDNLGEEEREIIKSISHFPYILKKSGSLKAPHLLIEYLRSLATKFHKYYDTVRVLGSSKEASRLALLKALKIIIAEGLDLLGVDSPEEM
ncbi:MAG: arginine--tRNA ligase [Elusimicrobiota bacterium]